MSNNDPPIAKVRQFPEVNGLNEVEVGTIISYFVYYEGKMAPVKKKFEELADKKISLDALSQIYNKYQETIEHRIKKIKDRLKRNPLAREEFQLKVLRSMCKEANEVKLRGSFRIGKDDFMADYRKDAMMIHKCIDLSHKIVMDNRKLELEERKLALREKQIRLGPITGTDDFDDEDNEVEDDEEISYG